MIFWDLQQSNPCNNSSKSTKIERIERYKIIKLMIKTETNKANI